MSKFVKDCIHSRIELNETVLKFVDVPEFQRLRRISQNASSKYAFPNSVHTRFEHSLGVMHLAGKMFDQISPEKDLRLKTMIQVAALYHDIGHAAYSHLFDEFLKKYPYGLPFYWSPNCSITEPHEVRSTALLQQVNNRLKIYAQSDIDIMKNMILGNYMNEYPKWWFEIVNNKHNGIDVDRLDYLARDSYSTGLPSFQYEYIMLNAYISKDNHIEFKDKAKYDIEDMKNTRKRMFQVVYKHHTAKKVDRILFCCFMRIGSEITCGGWWKLDEYFVEVEFRQHELTADLMEDIDNRKLDHVCPLCKDFEIEIKPF